MTLDGHELGRIKRIITHSQLRNSEALRRISLELEDGKDDILKRFILHPSEIADSLIEEELEDEISLTIFGWALYYAADYSGAGRAFLKAWEMQGEWSDWAAFGCGKVCSDLGCWFDARSWLLSAMDSARSKDDIDRISACMGALGEVFLKSGKPSAALELFWHDARLIPAGSSDSGRVENYLSICLGRMGARELAEPRLWAAYLGAADHDPVSAAYARSHLAVLSVTENDPSLFQRVREQPAIEDPMLKHGRVGRDDGMPRGFMEIAKAWHRKEDPGIVLKHLHEARNIFGSTHPVESAWTNLLIGTHGGEADDSPTFEELNKRPYPKCPVKEVSAIHTAWAEIDLNPDQTPFAEITSLDGIPWNGIRHFFI